MSMLPMELIIKRWCIAFFLREFILTRVKRSDFLSFLCTKTRQTLQIIIPLPPTYCSTIMTNLQLYDEQFFSLSKSMKNCHMLRASSVIYNSLNLKFSKPPTGLRFAFLNWLNYSFHLMSYLCICMCTSCYIFLIIFIWYIYRPRKRDIIVSVYIMKWLIKRVNIGADLQRLQRFCLTRISVSNVT